MTDSLDPEVAAAIANILAGESAPDDHTRLQQWVAGDPDRAARVELVYRMWRQGRTPEYDGDVVAFLDRLHGAIVLPVSDGRQPRVRRLSRTIGFSLSGIAAAGLLLLIGWQTSLRHFTGQMTNRMSVYSTGNGQRATVVLPDGSSVLLNVASRLEVPADYAAGNRTIRLAGEAIFDVRHQAEAPLSVVAGPSTTRVLGTRFLVRHYATDTAATVAVRDGKVAVGDVVLTAEEQITVSHERTSVVQRANISQFTFANGVLTLDEMPLADALAALNRWYDADIRLGSPALATQRVKGTFTTGSMADLSEILAFAFDVRVVREGRTLTLHAK